MSMYISSYVKGGIKIRAKYFILENRLIQNNNHVCIVKKIKSYIMSFKDISILKIIRAVLLTEKNVKLYMEKGRIFLG